jgi:hypothetical protein
MPDVHMMACQNLVVPLAAGPDDDAGSAMANEQTDQLPPPGTCRPTSSQQHGPRDVSPETGCSRKRCKTAWQPEADHAYNRFRRYTTQKVLVSIRKTNKSGTVEDWLSNKKTIFDMLVID